MNQAAPTLKWREVYSLAILNAAVAISWIAYHEYQPILMEKMEITHLVSFLVLAKAIILVVIPPFAGWIADYMMKRNGKYLIIFTVGISATAMVFMIVATMIGTSDLVNVKPFLPVMIVLWLICMNLFVSPANSMIEAFAPAKQLPIVMGVLFLITELVYSLEPVIVALVSFFGDTLTFVVGGVLIAGSGWYFHRVSSDEVMQRKQALLKKDRVEKQQLSAFFAIAIVGLILGIGKAFLVEFLPDYMHQRFPDFGAIGDYISFIILGLCAITGFLISGRISRSDLQRNIMLSFIILVVGVIGIFLANSPYILILAALIVGASFTILNISGLPFAIQNLSVKHVTYGVGIYIGASEIFTGIVEYVLL